MNIEHAYKSFGLSCKCGCGNKLVIDVNENGNKKEMFIGVKREKMSWFQKLIMKWLFGSEYEDVLISLDEFKEFVNKL
jgi:hypothetical protein